MDLPVEVIVAEVQSFHTRSDSRRNRASEIVLVGSESRQGLDRCQTAWEFTTQIIGRKEENLQLGKPLDPIRNRPAKHILTEIQQREVLIMKNLCGDRAGKTIVGEHEDLKIRISCTINWNWDGAAEEIAGKIHTFQGLQSPKIRETSQGTGQAIVADIEGLQSGEPAAVGEVGAGDGGEGIRREVEGLEGVQAAEEFKEAVDQGGVGVGEAEAGQGETGHNGGGRTGAGHPNPKARVRDGVPRLDSFLRRWEALREISHDISLLLD